MKHHLSESEKIRLASNLKSAFPLESVSLEEKIDLIIEKYEEDYR